MLSSSSLSQSCPCFSGFSSISGSSFVRATATLGGWAASRCPIASSDVSWCSGSWASHPLFLLFSFAFLNVSFGFLILILHCLMVFNVPCQSTSVLILVQVALGLLVRCLINSNSLSAWQQVYLFELSSIYLFCFSFILVLQIAVAHSLLVAGEHSLLVAVV